MEDTESTSVLNYSALGSMAALIVICAYLLAGTKLLKFIQFFMLKKQYKHLEMRISPSSVQQDEQHTYMNAIMTPRPGPEGTRHKNLTS